MLEGLRVSLTDTRVRTHGVTDRTLRGVRVVAAAGSGDQSSRYRIDCAAIAHAGRIVFAEGVINVRSHQAIKTDLNDHFQLK